MNNNYSILKVRDSTDNFYTEIPGLFDLPMRLLINGKSQLSGKTTIILNLLANPNFPYHKLFKGENIYIFSNNKLDNKLKMMGDRLIIPENNMNEFDAGYVEQLYEKLEDEFLEETAQGGKPANRLIIFDDCGYSGSLKSYGKGTIIDRLICNGRHLNLSQIYTSQKYSQCSTCLRTNITGAILFGTTAKEVDLITEDMSYFENRKDFIKMYRNNTKLPRSFIIVNFSQGLNPDSLYYDMNFNLIKN